MSWITFILATPPAEEETRGEASPKMQKRQRTDNKSDEITPQKDWKLCLCQKVRWRIDGTNT